MKEGVMTHKTIWKHLSIAAALTGSFISAEALGASFQLRDNNSSLIGVAHAGSAATVGDVATMANNPASMTYLNKHAVAFSLVTLSPSFKFKAESATAGALGGGANISANNSGSNGGSLAAVPAFYLMWNVNDRLKAGINVTTPFGLKTEYNKDWVGSYYAIKSEVKTININPSVAYKINNVLSIGAGIQIQRLDATLSNRIATSSTAEVTGGGWGFGGNAGILFEPRKGTRFGLAYRSHLKTDVTGSVNFENRNATVTPYVAYEGGKAETSITLPEIVTLSFAQDVTAQWTVLADLQYTRWSRLQELRIRFPDGNANGSVADKVQRFGYSDSWFASAGARYKANDKWTFKFGLAFDQSPTKDGYRDPRMPDANRMWYAGGLEYTTNEQLKFSLDYVFINVNEANIDLDQPTSNGKLRGKFDSHVHVLGAKVHYKF
jgi:long-chain fatty acid transport protein